MLLLDLIANADILLVVPPFAAADRPSLGVHVLQACAREAGFRVSVYYANLAFAARIGLPRYDALCHAKTHGLLGERTFARGAYGVPPLGHSLDAAQDALDNLNAMAQISLEDLRIIEQAAYEFGKDTGDAIAATGIRLVGFTTTFEQTAASIAMLNRYKEKRPDAVAILGGANCAGEMAKGVLSLSPQIDYVFDGEAEQTFIEFLRAWQSHDLPVQKIVRGEACRNLDALPPPDFDQFEEQRGLQFPEEGSAFPGGVFLTFESSRGCWWGEKHHCTFCGLNAEGMASRQKSPDVVASQLSELVERYGKRQILMADNIMPRSYFKTLLPRLARELPGLSIFYEQKANLSLDEMELLSKAGVTTIQPGIESLSTRLLTLMDKGCSARSNIQMMRYASATGVTLHWHLLIGFPGDRKADYETQIAMMPLLSHLEAPINCFRMRVDRFSPYYFAASQYGIEDLRPLASYFDVLPIGTNASEIAYHFDANFAAESECGPDVESRMRSAVSRWIEAAATKPRPVLVLVETEDGEYLLIDSRPLEDAIPFRALKPEAAEAAMVARPLASTSEVHEWARRERLAIEVDGWHVPLAVAQVDLIRRFESARRPAAGRGEQSVLHIIQEGEMPGVETTR